MNYEDVRIDIKGFDEASGFKRFLKAIVHDLHMEAPSDATTTASLTLCDSEVTCAIQISSSQGVFSAQGRGPNGRTVARKVVHDLREQIDAWKHLRWKRSPELGATNTHAS